MDEQHIDEVVFVEIKSGNSQLSNNERSLKDAVESERIRGMNRASIATLQIFLLLNLPKQKTKGASVSFAALL